MDDDIDEAMQLVLDEIRAMGAEINAPFARREAASPQDEPDLSDFEKYTREIEERVAVCLKDRGFAVLVDRAIRKAPRESSDWL